MEVNGRLSVKVDVSFRDCLDIVVKKLGYKESKGDVDYFLLDANDENNKTGTKAVYKRTDIARHGRSAYVYDLVTAVEEEVENYELALKLLEKFKGVVD